MAIKLRQDETIQIEATFHWMTLLFPGLFAGFCALVAIGLVANPDAKGGSIFWTLVIGVIPLLYKWLKNKNRSYIVTNQRLYVEDGIISKAKVDIPFNKINDIRFNQGLLQRIFGTGNVLVMTGNDHPTMLVNISLPEEFREALSNVCSKKAV